MKVKPDQPLAPESTGTVDRALRDAAGDEAELPCAVAFEICARLGKPPEEIGAAADRVNIRLTKCQLGLFGYPPSKKIVKAAAVVEPELEQAIRSKLTGGRLPCRDAWNLAQAFRCPKMAVSAACETLGVKIKPCQLGAF